MPHLDPILTLFLVIGLGHLIGSVRVGPFSLGVAGVLFAGIATGSLAPGKLELPPIVATLGLVLFVYCIGLTSGPGVFAAFSTTRGLRLSLLTLAAVSTSALVCLGLARWTDLPPLETAGLFCGALTNTPALAAQIEFLGGSSQPAVGYSVAYPLGVLGLFLAMALVSHRSLKSDVEKWEAGSGGGPVFSRNYRVTRLKPNGNQLEAGWLQHECGLVVARRLHQGILERVGPDAVLAPGDLVVAVGTELMHTRGAELMGEIAPEHQETNPILTYRRFFVSNRSVVERPLRELALPGTITRVRRGDVEMTADPDLTLAPGDVVRVVADPREMGKLAEFFGDSLEAAAHPNLLSISIGLVAGVLLGSIPLPMGGSLGAAGGALIAGLVLGRLGRSGSLIWTLSLEANLTLRHVGLVLFLAAVGLTAGSRFVPAFQAHGAGLLLGGALITLTSTLVLALGGRFWLRENLVPLLGMMAGVHTQPAALAFGESLAKCNGVGVGYASVFPVAMLAKIVLATVLVSALR